MRVAAMRPVGGLQYHAWASHQDTLINTLDGSCGFYLERPIIGGRLDADWNYRLMVGEPGPESQVLMTICRE